MVADAEAIERASPFAPVAVGERRAFRGSFSGYERDRLFYNAGGTLVGSAYVFGLDGDHDGRAAAPVDIDGDGDLDLALLTLQGLRLFENTADEQTPPAARRYARVRLAATRSAAPALGAVVTLEAGGATRRDYVRITEGFQTQVPLDLHFGLGGAERIDRLTVAWPSGAREAWTDLPADRLLRVVEGRREVAADVLARWPDGTRPQPAGAPTTALDTPRLDGGAGPLASGDRPAVVNFWAPWCAPCNVELPQLAALAGRYGGRIDFAGVSVEVDDLDSVRGMIRDLGVPYPQFLAAAPVMERFFGGADAAALPSTYVFDARGRLRRQFRGAITEADLDALLRSLHDEGLFEADLELAARSAARAGDLEQAIAHYRRLAARRPGSAQPLYRLGVAALELGDGEQAREALEQAVRRAPANPMAQFHLGLARLRSGQPGQGFASLQAALALAGRDAAALTRLGDAAAGAGQLWLAVDALSLAVEADPASTAAWLGKARAHRARRELDRAAAAYQQALVLDPESSAARRELSGLISDRR